MKKWLFAALFVAASVCFGETYRLEGESMTAVGDWLKSNDTDGTGGSFLCSNAKNIKLSASYVVPEAGKYILWVHTETRNEGWRRSQIRINGIPFGKFGDEKLKNFSKPVWHWRKLLMPLEIKSANEVIKVEITALSAASRFDSVVLTTDAAFAPDGMTISEVDEAAEELYNED